MAENGVNIGQPLAISMKQSGWKKLEMSLHFQYCLVENGIPNSWMMTVIVL